MIDALATAAPRAFGPRCPLGLPIGLPAVATWSLDGLLDLRADASREAALDEVADRLTLPRHELHCGAALHGLARLVVRAHAERVDAAARAAKVPVAPLDAHLPAHGDEAPGEAAGELWLLGLAARNPAYAALRPLFAPPDDVVACAAALEAAMRPREGRGVPADDLVARLRAPASAHPGSLRDQLAFALDDWGDWVPEGVAAQALRVVDAADEATRFRGGGPGPAQAPVIVDEGEHERFTPDREWMSEVVMMAKLTHVWLDQLSKRHGREIRRLDQIPDEALDRLARWGFTGLWLIGLWARSPASREIKRRMGNPEALSSAYALYDDVVAEDLGGDAALDDLRRRAEERGIRLCADMVPNHVGVDARWVVAHPEYFVWLDHPPFPGYTFDGPDLCADERVGVYLEDGYWNHSDAAVVFKRVDHHTGEVRYLYHGNDGTQMPWNDTAQIDFLNPAAREAVADRITAIARRFPMIRFDAAMTLARRHIRRLWHPPPGEGGAIPSRSRYAADPEAFDRAMPREFWREVVDRINAEAPDTLLLAEAFWMMEGYFVRTLGMHRVYNSAFMNMLKSEDNAGYRKALGEVLALSPDVLQRFANFMNNPDEETAIAQFGDADKYFGVATLMVTLPGLPLFGHGQVGGFTEKYGMEYRRAYQDEAEKDWLVERHEREIFPLMRRRRLFAGAEHFELYDFVTPEGAVDQNVFAYTNRRGDERALVLYNNAYATTSGRVRRSTETARGRTTLCEALGLEPEALYRFRDHRDGAWYLRYADALASDGLYAALPGYRCHVFLDFAAVALDPTWARLADALDGEGAADLDARYAALAAEEEP